MNLPMKMPTAAAVSVSPAIPDKLVVNGCDLVNRDELSASQNRELQRYINANSHLLGFMDKEKQEASESGVGGLTNGGSIFPSGFDSSFSVSDRRSEVNSAMADLYPSTQASFYRISSPASSDYSKRKGVSWSDSGKLGERARSHSPPASALSSRLPSGDYHQEYYSSSTYPAEEGWGVAGAKGTTGSITNYDPSPYTSAEKRGGRDDYDPYGTRKSRSVATKTTASSQRPWTMEHGQSNWGREAESDMAGSQPAGWKGYPKSDIPTYSALDHHPHDYFRFKEISRARSRSAERASSHDAQDEIKFYGYGDNPTSGIELRPRQWAGGEVISDPSYIRKYTSVRPRRFFYSPIGDGVVAADGVELKRGPPDLTPRISVRHERYVEQGKGQPGHRLYEHLWDEGGPGHQGDDGGFLGGNVSSGGVERPPPMPRAEQSPRQYPAAQQQMPQADAAPPPRSSSALSSAPSIASTDRTPREGWTKTFIVNPRELINQYGTETPTSIFDLKDHTPKLLTTVKECITPVPGQRVEAME